jgi:hypothetical protein
MMSPIAKINDLMMFPPADQSKNNSSNLMLKVQKV